jgi:two-component system response regulator FixJ
VNRFETNMPDGAVKCLIYADGDEQTARALASVLRGNDLRVIRSGDPGVCVDLLAARHWDCLVIVAAADTDSLLHVLTQCRRRRPDVPLLAVVRHGDTAAAVRAMKAGAADCIETPVTPDKLLAAVTGLCRKTPPLARDTQAQLTPTERTILQHVLEGRTTREIADLLSRSPRTIEVHRRHVMKKLGATSLIDLVKYAMARNAPAVKAPPAD